MGWCGWITKWKMRNGSRTGQRKSQNQIIKVGEYNSSYRQWYPLKDLARKGPSQICAVTLVTIGRGWSGWQTGNKQKKKVSLKDIS